MYISSFMIKNFGIFSNISVEGLKPGLTIFYGANEAGKTTCMEFLRSILTGFPKRKRNSYNTYEIRKDDFGGSILIDCADLLHGKKIYVSRFRDKSLQVTSTDGEALSEDLLTEILGGVTPDVYRNIFGFSLSELANIESLSDNDVRSVLYGASFGLNLKSPRDVIKTLESQRDGIFLVKGKNQPLNVALLKLDKLQAEISEYSQKNATFDDLSAKLGVKRKELEELDINKSQLEHELRLMERRLEMWKLWEELRVNELRLAELGAARENFPLDALARLEKHETEYELNENHATGTKEKLTQLKGLRDSIEVDNKLLQNRLKLRQLITENKAAYSSALVNLPQHKKACEYAEQELLSLLAQLGPGWTCERIKITDRSLFAREGMEKTAREHDQSEMEYHGAMTALKQAAAEVSGCEEHLERASGELKDLPMPDAILDETEREKLREQLTRLQEGERMLPARERAHLAAKSAFKRSLEQINLAAPQDGTDLEDTREILDTVLANQAKALDMAKLMQDLLLAKNDLANKIKAAQDVRDNIKRKQEEVAAKLRATQGPDRAALDIRARAFRELRGISTNLETEKAKLADIESAIANIPVPARSRNIILSLFGILFVICAILIFVAAWFMELKEVILGDISIPINIYTGYVTLAFGVIALAGGLPGKNPEYKRYKREMGTLEDKRQTVEKKLAELQARAAALCADAKLDSMDPILLETGEALLERDREQCFHDEQTQKDIENLKRDYIEARRNAEKLQEEEHRLENEIQQYRHKWHNLLQDLKLTTIPMPENAPAFFMRAEQARLAYDNVFNTRKEFDELQVDIADMKTAILNVKPVSEAMNEGGENAPIQEIVAHILSLCREADLAREQRIRLEAAVGAARSEVERARKKQEDAALRLEIAKKRSETALGKWSELLEKYGLEKNLDPQTVRNAFELMDSCLSTEEKLTGLKQRVEQDRQALDALRIPLEQLCAALNRIPLNDGDGNRDWILTLESVMEEAEANLEKLREKERLEKQIKETEIDLGSQEATLEMTRSRLDNLFNQTGVKTREEYVALARTEEERRNLTDRINAIKSTMQVAAGELSLTEFLESFATTDLETLQIKAAELHKAIQNSSDQGRALAESIGAMEENVKALSSQEVLAQLRQTEIATKEESQALAREWLLYAMATELIKRAKRNYELERQPNIIKLASRLFAKITDGTWQAINISLDAPQARQGASTADESAMLMLKKDGSRFMPDQLSKGTQEQAYLALRLAYIMDHASHPTPLPVLMDEILVNFDRERAEIAASTFHNLENGQQIFYFTCHPHVVEMFKGVSANIPVFKLGDRNIIPVTGEFQP